MTDKARHSGPTAATPGAPLEEAYRRIAQLHYALATTDSLSEQLHQRAIDDLMDVLEMLEPAMHPRNDARPDRSGRP